MNQIERIARLITTESDPDKRRAMKAEIERIFNVYVANKPEKLKV